MNFHDEVEVKFFIPKDGLQDLREKIKAMSRVPARVFERNTLYDTKGLTLRKRGIILRLREEELLRGASRRTLTLKKNPKKADLFAREESPSVKLDENLDNFFGLICVLGNFEPVFIYEKERESWYGGEGDIYIGKLPLLGYILEIEGSPAKIKEIVMRLGLKMKDAIKKDYWQMYKECLGPSVKDALFLNKEKFWEVFDGEPV